MAIRGTAVQTTILLKYQLKPPSVLEILHIKNRAIFLGEYPGIVNKQTDAENFSAVLS
ncbi:hypothetical protein D3C86_2136530 [compost metagenome]